MRVAVVFPRANRRAGVERIAWDLSNFLAAQNETTFVGLAMEEVADNAAQFHPVRRATVAPSPLTFRRSAAHALGLLRPDVTLTLGAECPPGDVYWVQSVHRAFLDRGQGPTVLGWQTPGWTRSFMPRHRVLLSLENRYFHSVRPRDILCTSAQEMEDLNSYYGVQPSRCRVVPNGYDPSIFNTHRRGAERDMARTRLSLSPEDVSVLFVANELHRKGFGALIEALARINRPEARIDVVGRVAPGDYRGQIERLRLNNRIRWHGSSNDVLPFYAAADVLALPTLYEPFGMVIIEALASGLPVITSRLAGASSAVEHGGSGRLLKDPTDIGELASYLLEALDPITRREWATGAAQAAEPYAWPTIFAHIEKILQEAAQGRSTRNQGNVTHLGRSADIHGD